MTGKETVSAEGVGSRPAEVREKRRESLKILFVITGLGMGGAERVVVELADSLAERGHVPAIAYLKGDVIVRPHNADIPLVELGIDSLRKIPRGIRVLQRLISEMEPDVVHSHLVHANLFSRCARLFVDIPCLISTAHNTNEGSRARLWAYRATNGLSDVFTNVSRDAVAAFVRHGAAPKGFMRVVHNGIDVNRFRVISDVRPAVREALGVSSDKKLLIAVGRLEPQKDYANLLCALRKVRTVREDWVCIIVGEGALRDVLERQVIESELSDCVRLLGMRRDIPELLSAADLFVLSSAWEGFPLVVGEAMASCLPVIATDCGGVSEFLGADARFLVPPGNSALLADALLEALGVEEEELQKLGLANRDRVEAEFSLATSVARWLDIYQDVMQKRRCSS